MRLLLCALVLSAAAIGQIDEAAILEGAGDNWLTYSGDYASLRHSSLDQINLDNVGSLVAKWVYHVPGARRLETTPLVYDGVMYLTNTNELHALDAGTGRRIWSYLAEAPRRAQNRAVGGRRILFGRRLSFGEARSANGSADLDTRVRLV